MFILSLCIFSSCTPYQTTPHPPRKVDSLTVTQIDGRPYCSIISLSGRSSQWMIDSGASHSVIFENSSVLTDTSMSSSTSFQKNIHGVFGEQVTSMKYFKLNTQNNINLEGFAFPSKKTKAIHQSSGIIGLETLRNNHAHLYFMSDTLTWNTPPMKSAHILPLIEHPESRLFFLRTYIAGTTMHFLVDTGASRSILSMKTAKQIGIKASPSRAKVTGVHNQSQAANITPPLQLRFGISQNRITSRLFVTDLGHFKKNLQVGEAFEIHGIIGYDLLEAV